MMPRRLVGSLRWFILLLVAVLGGCFGDDRIRPDVERVERALPAPVQLVQAGPQTSLLQERDGEGNPLFYFGRVKVRHRGTEDLLTFLGFKWDRGGYFDDFVPHSLAPLQRGYRYAIATSFQWNILLHFPGLTGGVEINPRLPNKQYPLLDALLANQPAGSLNPTMLHGLGFMPAYPQVTVRPDSCGPRQTTRLFGFLDEPFHDAYDAAGSVVGPVTDPLTELIEGATKGFKEKLNDLLKLALAGVKEAIEFFANLGNDIYCELAGSTVHSGRVFVKDPKTAARVTNPDRLVTGARSNADGEPMRHAQVQARALYGVLQEKDTMNSEGRYELTLCNGLDYTVSVVLQGPAAEIVNTKVDLPVNPFEAAIGDPDAPIIPATPIWVELDEVGNNGADGYHESDIDDDAALWYIGSQIAHRAISDKFHFQPDMATISYYGAFGQAYMDLLKVKGGERALAACGQMSVIISYLALISPKAAAAAASAGDIDADIFAHTLSDKNKPTGVGVPIHEYGHHTVCEAIRKRASGGWWAKNAYLHEYTKAIVATHFNNDEQQQMPLFNTGESIADYLASRVYGYSDYFAAQPPPDGHLTVHPQWCVPTAPGYSQDFNCLDFDSPYVAPNSSSTAKFLMRSRASVMYDWTAALPNPGPNTFHLGLDSENIIDMIAASTPNVETQAMSGSNDIASQAQFCRVYLAHSWSCGDYQLDGPSDFEGVAINQFSIRWNWVLNAALAQTYVVQTAGAFGSFNDAFTLPGGAVPQWVQTGLQPNQRVTARVQTRRPGATSGNSIVASVCTRASTVGTTSLTFPGGTSVPHVGWGHNGASKYNVVRLENGAESLVATLEGPFSQIPQAVDDDLVAPGTEVRYRVDALNCDGLVTPGVPFPALPIVVPLSDADSIFVRAGASGDGTKANPVGTITEGLSLLAPSRSRLVVASGNYADWIDGPADGAPFAVFGSYAADFSSRAALAATVVRRGAIDRIVKVGQGEFALEFRPLVHTAGPSRFDMLVFDGTLDDVTFFVGSGDTTFQNSVLGAKGIVSTVDIGGPHFLFVDETSPTLSLTRTFVQGSVNLGLIGRAEFSTGAVPNLEVLESIVATRTEPGTLVGIDAAALTSRRSTIRQAIAPDWMVPGSNLLKADRFRSVASIIAGNTLSGIAEIGNSVVIGNHRMTHGKILNNLFYFAANPYLTFLPDPACPTATWVCPTALIGTDEVRNNIFQVNSLDALAITPWSSQPGNATITQNNMNQPVSWFGLWQPVGANQVATQVHFANANETSATPTFFAVRFRPATDAILLQAGANDLPAWLAGQRDLFGVSLRPAIGQSNVGAFGGPGF